MASRPSASAAASRCTAAGASEPSRLTLSSKDGPGTYCVTIHGRSASASASMKAAVWKPLTSRHAATSLRNRARNSGLACLLRADQLDGDLPAALRFPQVNDPHPADREPFDQTVGANMPRITILQRCHRAPCHPP